jgi:thymidylate synthase ThyX
VHPYVVESFTQAERQTLRRYVTNLDAPVFALVDLPEVVKGALYARYSRSAKSLRRLLLDEFAADLADIGAGTGEQVSADAEAATRAGKLYERVFSQYGDDSVAQLGGAHVAVEQASNLLTKQLEWGRLAAYLEQSTRYIPYDDKPGGRYRYYRDPDIMASGHARSYETVLDGVFDTYAALLPQVRAWAAKRYPRAEGTSEAAHRNAVGAKALDILRGLLPAATVSNVGIFASGQSYEQLLLRLRASELAEARWVGDRMLTELRQVIPSFLTRVDRPDRGGVWSEYLGATRSGTRALADALLAGVAAEQVPEVDLVEWSDDAETEVITGMLYPHTRLPETQLRKLVAAMPVMNRMRVLQAYTGERSNRRHKPGRALERVWYRFDICSDYGAFRDLQRHRMLTIDWQELSPRHGYDTPPEVEEAGIADAWHATLERQADLYDRLWIDLPRQAQYAVGFAYRLRWSMQLNARAAMQMIELRTTPQGHPSYRRICQEMHRLIEHKAGHRSIAAMMSHVDYSDGELERLEAERAAEVRLAERRRAQRT